MAEKVTARFSTVDTEYRKFNGRNVTILRELDDSERDREVGRMFHVSVDGAEFDVFADELDAIIRP